MFGRSIKAKCVCDFVLRWLLVRTSSAGSELMSGHQSTMPASRFRPIFGTQGELGLCVRFRTVAIHGQKNRVERQPFRVSPVGLCNPMEDPMKIAATLAVALLSVSSFAMAADNNGGKGGKDGMKTDPATTGSTTVDSTGDLQDQKKCREGTGGGAPCQEDDTVMPQ